MLLLLENQVGKGRGTEMFYMSNIMGKAPDSYKAPLQKIGQ